MSMNNTFTDEDLLIALPDYISGAKMEDELKAQIARKIGADADFREQYEEMRSTFGFLARSKFSEPPANYFSNLSVRINDRLAPAEKLSFWDKLSLVWKILIPVMTVIIALMIFLLTRDDRKQDYIALDTGRKSETVKPQSSDLSKTEDTGNVIEKGAADIQKSDESTTGIESRRIDNVKRYSVQHGAFETSNSNKTTRDVFVADNIDDYNSDTEDETNILLGTSEIEEPVEDEFLQLSPEDQEEILEILKNS
jgi:hypothetical protein